jgi:hypothetical protein
LLTKPLPQAMLSSQRQDADEEMRKFGNYQRKACTITGKMFMSDAAKLKYQARLVDKGLLEADEITGLVAWDVRTKLPRWTKAAPKLALTETSLTLTAVRRKFPARSASGAMRGRNSGGKSGCALGLAVPWLVPEAMSRPPLQPLLQRGNNNAMRLPSLSLATDIENKEVVIGI